MHGRMARENRHRAGGPDCGANGRVPPGQHVADTGMVRIVPGSQILAIFKCTALIGRLEQDRDRELRAVEMPIQLIAFVIGHDVQPGHRVGHAI